MAELEGFIKEYDQKYKERLASFYKKLESTK